MQGFKFYHDLGIICLQGATRDKIPYDKYASGLPKRTTAELEHLDDLLAKDEISIILPCGEQNGITAVDVDTDDEAILSAIPFSGFKRLGNKGATFLFEYNGEAPLEFLDKEGNLVVEIKSQSRKGTPLLVHLPPSIHPKGMRYRWADPETEFDPILLTPLDIHTLTKSLAIVGVTLKKSRVSKEFKASEFTALDSDDVGITVNTTADTKVITRTGIVNATTATPLENTVPVVESEELTQGSSGIRGEKSLKSDLKLNKKEKEFVEKFLTCVPCDLDYNDWRDTAYVTRAVLGDEEGERQFTDYVERCPSNIDNKTYDLVTDFFTRDLPSIQLSVGVLLRIAKENRMDMRKLPSMKRTTLSSPSGHKDAEELDGDEHLCVNNDARVLAHKLIFEYKKIWYFQERIHLYMVNKWIPIDSKEAFIELINKMLVELDLNYITIPASKNRSKELMQSTELNHNQLSNLYRSIRGISELHQKERNVIPESWIDGRAGGEWCIPLENGILNIKTRELYPHDGSFSNLGVLPYKYDPEATCPFWDSIVNNYFQPGYEEHHVQQLYRIMACCFTNALHHKKIFVFCGGTDSGKSSVMNLISWFVGRDYVSTRSYTSLNTDFATAGFDTKKVLIMDDFKFNYLNEKSVLLFKNITGGTYIDINCKGVDTYAAKASVVPIITTNDSILQVSDKGDALRNRMIFFTFMRMAGDIKLPSNVFEIKVKSEMSGILNKVLDGVQDILNKRYVEQPGGLSGQVVEEFINASKDHVQNWMEASIIEEPDLRSNSFLSTKQLWQSFQEFMDETCDRSAISYCAEYRSIRAFSKQFTYLIENKTEWSYVRQTRTRTTRGYGGIIMKRFSELDL